MVVFELESNGPDNVDQTNQGKSELHCCVQKCQKYLVWTWGHGCDRHQSPPPLFGMRASTFFARAFDFEDDSRAKESSFCGDCSGCEAHDKSPLCGDCSGCEAHAWVACSCSWVPPFHLLSNHTAWKSPWWSSLSQWRSRSAKRLQNHNQRILHQDLLHWRSWPKTHERGRLCQCMTGRRKIFHEGACYESKASSQWHQREGCRCSHTLGSGDEKLFSSVDSCCTQTASNFGGRQRTWSCLFTQRCGDKKRTMCKIGWMSHVPGFDRVPGKRKRKVSKDECIRSIHVTNKIRQMTKLTCQRPWNPPTLSYTSNENYSLTRGQINSLLQAPLLFNFWVAPVFEIYEKMARTWFWETQQGSMADELKQQLSESGRSLEIFRHIHSWSCWLAPVFKFVKRWRQTSCDHANKIIIEQLTLGLSRVRV